MPNLLQSFSGPPDFKPDPYLLRIYNYKSAELGHMHKMRLYLFVRLMQKLLKNGTISNTSKAVDIGCNGGVYSKLLSELGFSEVLGIDIEPSMIATAGREFGSDEPGRKIGFQIQNAETFVRPAEFDFILCTEVIEHTDNQAAVIKNINGMLKKGGVAIITLPNVISVPYLLTWLSYKIQGRKFDKEMKDHLSYPFYKTIRLFRNRPYKLVSCTGTNLYYWHFLHKLPGFNFLNKLNFQLGLIPPLKFLTQYFYIVLKNDQS